MRLPPTHTCVTLSGMTRVSPVNVRYVPGALAESTSKTLKGTSKGVWLESPTAEAAATG